VLYALANRKQDVVISSVALGKGHKATQDKQRFLRHQGKVMK